MINILDSSLENLGRENNHRRTFAVLVLIIAVLVMSCQSNVDKVADWYEQRDKGMRDQYPTMAICDRNEREWWWFSAEVEEVVENYTRAMAGVGQTGNRVGVQSLAAEMQQYIQVRESALLVATGWSEEESYVCAQWLMAKRDPGAKCASGAEISAEGLGYANYGWLRYCIENSVPPFDKR